MQVSIILPTYNEAGNIILLLKEIQNYITNSYEIIVVDDNSPDGTSEKVSEYIRTSKNNHIKLVTRMKDPGLAHSLQEGIFRAAGDIIVWMDCDFSHPPHIIPKLIEKVSQGYDVCVASRFIAGGRQKQKAANEVSIVIHMSTYCNSLLSSLFSMNFHDFTSGFIAIKKETLHKVLPLRGSYGEYFIDLIVRLSRCQASILEIPFTNAPRLSGESKTAPTIQKLFLRVYQYTKAVIQLL